MYRKFIFIFLSGIIGAHAGEISGTIHFASVQQQQRPALKRYGYHTPGGAMTAGWENDIRAVVYIAENVPDSTFRLPSTNPILDQRNEQFHPYILPVLVGTTVEFPNNDKVFHNVFSFSKTKTFDLGKYPTKTSKTVTFDKTGIVSVYCEIHSHMNAFILVLPNPWFCQVRGDGEFRLSNVPAGTWTVKAFFGRGKQLSQKVTLKENQKLELNFYQ